jgi:hypothetical protein
MILSILLWIPKALSLILLTALAFPLAPFLALFIIYAEEYAITGEPSLLPNTPRAFLIPAFRIWQTPDAPLDEFWYGDYQGWPKTGKTQADYDASIWLRWLCRVVWLWRNAAYGFGAKWGFSYAPTLSDDPLWRSGKPCNLFYKVTNPKGEVGWNWKAELYMTPTRYIEINLGYKLMGDSIQGKKFVAIYVNPFRTVA